VASAVASWTKAVFACCTSSGAATPIPSGTRDQPESVTEDARFRAGLLSARAVTGFVLGFANVNYITVLLDLFGASLQSKNPHQEYVVPNDVRRHGGGMGMWLGIWSWCWIASLAVGFQVGAAIIGSLSPDWGFYVVILILAAALVLNIMAPETRRAAYRKSVTEVYDRDENYITRRVSRGECKLHISTEGPLYWFEEVWAGIKLIMMMMCQPGFFVLALYLAWIYAQIVLVIILLGALLSRDYQWQPRYVGAGVMSIAIGALLAIPLTKARIFSRERKSAFRTDSMTFQKQVTWSSHLVRRAVFTLTLPLMGLAYTIGSAGRPSPFIVPLVFAGALGFFSILAIAECHGLIMETFDTCDLQPGVNTRHRFESMAVQDRRRRTNYTSFPRVCAGIFASQTIAFVLAGVATLVGGSMTRRLGAQKSTGSTAGILLGLTILLTLVLWRFKETQVIPNHTFGTRRDTAAWTEFKDLEKIGRGADWKAVVIGHPSGKMRRMNVLELGALSRWTEIRKLNFLLKGPRLGEETDKEKKTRSFRDSW
jgi:MFS family permease